MKNISVKPVVLKAKGEFCSRMCGDCIYLDHSDSNGKGEYYCPKMAEGSFWKYVSPGESACRHFVEK